MKQFLILLLSSNLLISNFGGVTGHSLRKSRLDQSFGQQLSDYEQDYFYEDNALAYNSASEFEEDEDQILRNEVGKIDPFNVYTANEDFNTTGCMQKVMLVQEVKYDEREICVHKTRKECFDNSKTEFVPQVVTECNDVFIKKCFIRYRDEATQHTVQVCDERMSRNCTVEGKEICKDEYFTVCETSTVADSKSITDDVPNCVTDYQRVCQTISGVEVCNSVPVQNCTVAQEQNGLQTKTDCRQEKRPVCGPEMCPLVKQEPFCRNIVKTTVQEVPHTECDVVPSKQCQDVTKVMPMTVSEQQCVDVPEEVCSVEKVNPRTVTVPRIKLWCPNSPTFGVELADLGVNFPNATEV